MRRAVLTILAVGVAIVGGYYWLVQGANPGIVQAVGDVTATFPSAPMFMVTNWLPGDSEVRTFSVSNSGADIFQLAVRTENELSTPLTPDLAAVSEVVISDDDGVVWYGTGSPSGSATLLEWYSEPYVMLGNIDPGQMREFTVSVYFPNNAGNEYQLTQTQFDIVLMEELVDDNGDGIPAECRHIAFAGAPIMGTEGDDWINGNSSNNLIFGLGGDDRINGHGGNDCIVGGAGDDRISGGTGKDFIWGGDGDDWIEGGTDEDMIWGGNGNDRIDGGSDPDQIWGGAGDDIIDGGSGNDIIYGEGGNDKLDGGSGIDTIYGGDGDDVMLGGSSNDFLYGDGGYDSADGEAGLADTCVAEVKIKCEL